MSFSRFEEIIAWQKSKELVTECYSIFGTLRDYSFRDQILRAALSIMNNIAEGYERKGEKQFSHFLYISKGSCGEVKSMLYLALELKYISDEQFQRLAASSTEISKMLVGLIKSMSK